MFNYFKHLRTNSFSIAVRLILVAMAASLPTPAFAHAVTAGGFIDGLNHPILGFDHLLAMLSVGVLSAQMGGRALWLIPTNFVVVMLIGGLLGIANISLPPVELGIAISVLLLGIALAADKKISIFFAVFFVSIFAVFHGYAHGLEMPHLASPLLYVLGFIVGTACIHIVGLTTGLLSKDFPKGKQLLRYLGAAIAGIGFHLIIL